MPANKSARWNYKENSEKTSGWHARSNKIVFERDLETFIHPRAHSPIHPRFSFSKLLFTHSPIHPHFSCADPHHDRYL
jgi:hypothetical protein